MVAVLCFQGKIFQPRAIQPRFSQWLYIRAVRAFLNLFPAL